MKRFLLILLAVTAILISGCGGEKYTSNKIRLGTGGTGGMYYAYGNELAKLLEADGKNFKLDVKATAGSAANLRLMREKFLDLAIVQSDVLNNAVKGTGLFTGVGSGEGYAAVAGLYTEACQIIVDADSDIKDIRDLVGKRVSVGEEESGVRQNASQILMAHGLTFEMIESRDFSYSEGVAAFKDGKIDALFITAGTSMKSVVNLAKDKKIRFLSIAPDIQNNMMTIYKGYTRCTIPANTYEGQTEEVSTIGVKAVLIASTELKDDDVAYLTEFVIKNADKLPNNAADNITTDYAVRDIPASFHVGAAKFYETEGFKVTVYSGKSGEGVKASQD